MLFTYGNAHFPSPQKIHSLHMKQISNSMLISLFLFISFRSFWAQSECCQGCGTRFVSRNVVEFREQIFFERVCWASKQFAGFSIRTSKWREKSWSLQPFCKIHINSCSTKYSKVSLPVPFSYNGNSKLGNWHLTCKRQPHVAPSLTNPDVAFCMPWHGLKLKVRVQFAFCQSKFPYKRRSHGVGLLICKQLIKFSCFFHIVRPRWFFWWLAPQSEV